MHRSHRGLPPGCCAVGSATLWLSGARVHQIYCMGKRVPP